MKPVGFIFAHTATHTHTDTHIHTETHTHTYRHTYIHRDKHTRADCESKSLREFRRLGWFQNCAFGKQIYITTDIATLKLANVEFSIQRISVQSQTLVFQLTKGGYRSRNACTSLLTHQCRWQKIKIRLIYLLIKLTFNGLICKGNGLSRYSIQCAFGIYWLIM